MTTQPSTAPPAPPQPGRLVTSSFGSALTPPQVTALLNAVIDAAPFSGALTRAETATGKLAFPVSQPSGYGWLRELEQVPRLVLDDRSTVVSVCKLAGYVPVSAELLADAAVNVTNWVSSALTGSLSADLDRGILFGSGEPEPDGVLDQVDAVPGATLTEAAGAAMAAIGENGGQPDVIALSPTAFVAELTDADATGRLVHPGGLPDFLGLRCVQVPALPQPLVFDSRLCFLPRPGGCLLARPLPPPLPGREAPRTPAAGVRAVAARAPPAAARTGQSSAADGAAASGHGPIFAPRQNVKTWSRSRG